MSDDLKIPVSVEHLSGLLFGAFADGARSADWSPAYFAKMWEMLRDCDPHSKVLLSYLVQAALGAGDLSMKVLLLRDGEDGRMVDTVVGLDPPWDAGEGTVVPLGCVNILKLPPGGPVTLYVELCDPGDLGDLTQPLGGVSFEDTVDEHPLDTQEATRA